MNSGLTRRRTAIEAQPVPLVGGAEEAGAHHEDKITAAPQTSASWRLPAEAYGFGYLLTGTSLAVMGQMVMDQGAVDPSTQLIAWTKYCCTFLLSLALQLLVSNGGRRNGSTSAAAAGGTNGPVTPSGAPRASGPVLPPPAAPAASAGAGATERDARKAAWLTAAVGLLDTLSYGLNCLGFALCGSALSMVVFAACGQVFTAIMRRLVLRKTMTGGQALGVALVVVGLVVRSSGKLRDAIVAAIAAARAASAAQTSGAAAAAGTTATAAGAAAAAAAGGGGGDYGIASGVALIVMSALGYSLLGCLYEWLSVVRGPSMSHAQVATTTSLIGLLATSAFQLLYTQPRWQPLVTNRMAQRGLTWWPVVRLYGAFGALFTVHSLVQGVVLQRSGATAVGIISALRAAVVAVASGVLFCRPEAPQQCLTPSSAASAATVTAGALMWTLTGQRPKPQVPPARSEVAAHARGEKAASGAAAPQTGASEPPNHKFGKLS